MDNTANHSEEMVGYLRAMASVALRPLAEEVLDSYDKALLFNFRNHQARFTLRELGINITALKKKTGSEQEVVTAATTGGE